MSPLTRETFMDIHAPRLELHFPQRQAGAVLVFSILVLLILTVLGVASMSSSNMQERMAGNARLEAEAFEAASAGVSDPVSCCPMVSAMTDRIASRTATAVSVGRT